MLGALGIERQVRVLGLWKRRLERSRDDDLGRRVRRLALRIAGRHRVGRGIEERMALVQAVVEDRDLDPLAARFERRAPHPRCVDRGNAAVESGTVLHSSMDLADAGQLVETPDVTRWKDDRKRVQNDAVAPADPGAGNELANALLDRLLLHGDPRQPPEARRSVQLEAAVAAERLGEPGLPEFQDDLGKRPGFRSGSARSGQRGQRDE
jgi:hypothetical protein